MQRTLRFAQYLPRYGWDPIVLTIDPRAYEARYSGHVECPVPENQIHRAFGLDAARHLSIGGRYPRALALPDRWASWSIFAVRMAKRLAAERRIDALMSTFPVATAHQIGLKVAQRTGLPWIAEFRDPMWQGDYPPDPLVNRYWLDLERKVLAHAAAAILVTPSARADYAQRYPQIAKQSRLHLIENGYDEAAFQAAEARIANRPYGESRRDGPVTLLHSGVIYPSERNPSQLFRAIADLKCTGHVDATILRVILRAAGDTNAFEKTVRELGISDIVSFERGIAYEEALEEMLCVDGLLLLQASNCNAQIPAKAYEYLRARRPILALTDPIGDTARLVLSTSAGIVARLDSRSEIAAALTRFVRSARKHEPNHRHQAALDAYSREAQTGQLARILNETAERRQDG